MNSIKRAVLAGFVFIVALGFFASSAVASSSTNSAPVLKAADGSINSVLAQNLNITGAPSVCRIEASTPSLQGVLCASGSGIVYGIDVSSGIQGDGAIAGDSTTIPSANSGSLGYDKQGIKISPEVYTTTGSVAGAGSQGAGAWRPDFPARYENGLIVIRRGSANVIVRYRGE